MSFGKNLKKMRKERGLTQKELANSVGIKRSTVAGYESKDQEPSYEVLKKISKVLKCSIDYLLNYNVDNAVKEEVIFRAISSNEELKEFVENIKDMDPKDIDFYKKLVQFIESEKNK